MQAIAITFIGPAILSVMAITVADSRLLIKASCDIWWRDYIVDVHEESFSMTALRNFHSAPKHREAWHAQCYIISQQYLIRAAFRHFAHDIAERCRYRW